MKHQQTVPVLAKSDLAVLLLEVEADRFTGTLRLGADKIDTVETYYLNCKDAPAV